MDRLGLLRYCVGRRIHRFYGQGLAVDSARSYTPVTSGAGSPIRLAKLRPVACKRLARIGSANDGGYVVPLDAVSAANVLLSFGLSHDWRFERDFKNLKADALLHCYDHTISFRTASQYSAAQLPRFILQRKTGVFWKAFTWIDYLTFFRKDNIHFKQRIWNDRQNDSVTIDDVFGRLPAARSVFVKMDIEGSEYRVLDDLLRYSRDIVAMAIEFHDVDILPDLFNSLIDKIKRDFYIVHIHGNNMGGIAPFQFPIAPEITFLSKGFFGSPPAPSQLSYPVADLDRPNHPRLPEFTFEFSRD